MAAKHITKSEFLDKVWNYEENSKEWKFRGDKPAIIDFYANWCGPCMMLAPIMDELADEYAGKVDFYKVNTEDEMELSAAFRIRSIPSLLFCPKDGEPKMSQGALPKSNLKQIIENDLLG